MLNKNAQVRVVAALTSGSVISAMHFGEWSEPVNAESIPGTSPEFNTASNDGSPIQSPAGLSFYIASNRPGGLDGLYFVSARTQAVTPAVVYRSMPDDRMTVQPKIK